MIRASFAAFLIVTFFGCGPSGPTLAKTRGKVIYKNAPLKFGSVMFQHESGKIATGSIQPDGSFELQTVKPGDGAIVGKHRVRVVCLTSQDPNFKVKSGQEMPIGKSLIPEKYGEFNTTPLKDIAVQDIAENNISLNIND